jgi:hypothetical protein
MAGSKLPHPLPRWRLVIGEQGPSRPVELGWCCPLEPSADRGGITATGGVFCPPADRGNPPAGGVPESPADRGPEATGGVVIPPH